MVRLTKTEQYTVRLSKADIHQLERAYARIEDDNISFNAWVRMVLLRGMDCTGHKDNGAW